MTTYTREVQATLHVHLDDGAGTVWEAAPEDFKKFGLGYRHDAFLQFERAISDVLREAGVDEEDRLQAFVDLAAHCIYDQGNPSSTIRDLVEIAKELHKK